MLQNNAVSNQFSNCNERKKNTDDNTCQYYFLLAYSLYLICARNNNINISVLIIDTVMF